MKKLKWCSTTKPVCLTVSSWFNVCSLSSLLTMRNFPSRLFATASICTSRKWWHFFLEYFEFVEKEEEVCTSRWWWHFLLEYFEFVEEEEEEESTGDLIDKNYWRCLLLCPCKQVTDTWCSHSNIQFYKLTCRTTDKRNLSFPSNSLC